MRPAQQNRRMRGRGNNNNNNSNNNNRKGPNPLSRNYESNGPDVKVRGNAQHIAEKYTTLARDAQVSGDRVIAENYLQHAEHYNRIIMAAQAQNPQAFQREENFDEDGSDEDDEDGFSPAVAPVAARPMRHENPRHENSRHENPRQEINGSGPQPFIEGTPAEVIYGEEGSGSAKSDARSDDAHHQPREQRRPMRPRRQPRVEHVAPVAADSTQPEQPQPEQQPRQPVSMELQPVVTPVITGVEISTPKPVRAQPRNEARADVEVVMPTSPEAPKAPKTTVKSEAVAKAVPAEAEAEAEAPVRRRPGRPRRVVKEADAPEAAQPAEATVPTSDA